MSAGNFKSLQAHKGHVLECVVYGDYDNAAIECTQCGEVLLDFNNETEDEKAHEDLVQEISKRFSMEDLDEHVHALKSQEASNINNSSLEEQVDYLVQSGGEEWVRSLLLADRDETVQEEADRETGCEP